MCPFRFPRMEQCDEPDINSKLNFKLFVDLQTNFLMFLDPSFLIDLQKINVRFQQINSTSNIDLDTLRMMDPHQVRFIAKHGSIDRYTVITNGTGDSDNACFPNFALVSVEIYPLSENHKILGRTSVRKDKDPFQRLVATDEQRGWGKVCKFNRSRRPGPMLQFHGGKRERHSWKRIYVSMEISKKLKCRFDGTLYHRNSSKAKFVSLDSKLFEGISCWLEQLWEKSYHENWKHFRGKIGNGTELGPGDLGLYEERVAVLSGNLSDEIYFFFFPAAKKISSRFDKISTLYTVFFFFFSATTCVTRLQSGHSCHLEAFSSRQGPSPSLQLCQTLCRQAKATWNANICSGSN